MLVVIFSTAVIDGIIVYFVVRRVSPGELFLIVAPANLVFGFVFMRILGLLS